MRLLTSIGGWPSEQYREKIKMAARIIKQMEDMKFINDIFFIRAVFSAYPRAIYGPSPLVAPYTELWDLETTEFSKLVELANKISQAYSDRNKNLIARNSQLKIYLAVKALDENLAGSLTIRISGFEKRNYGDIELYLYKLDGDEETEFFDLLREHIKQDKYIATRLADLSEYILNEIGSVKFTTIMGVDDSIKYGYGSMLIAAHGGPTGQAFQSHIALIRRYAKYRVDTLRRRSEYYEVESDIVKKLGSIYNFNKVVGAFIAKRNIKTIMEAFEKEYRNSGVETSQGSYIVVARDGTLSQAYGNILKIIKIMLEPFADERQFNRLVENAVKKIKEKLYS
ncbi:MAG: hypothetical protein F7C38_05095 [Desulfurococcales archaeon]|nr:hypothetical protein [Desulfurococcales archaeon]